MSDTTPPSRQPVMEIDLYPTLADLVAVSVPDSPPLRPIPRMPQSTHELEDILHNSTILLCLHCAGHPDPDSCPDLESMGQPKPIRHYLAFANAKEREILERLEGMSAELTGWRLRKRQAEVAWMRQRLAHDVPKARRILVQCRKAEGQADQATTHTIALPIRPRTAQDEEMPFRAIIQPATDASPARFRYHSAPAIDLLKRYNREEGEANTAFMRHWGGQSPPQR